MTIGGCVSALLFLLFAAAIIDVFVVVYIFLSFLSGRGSDESFV